MSPFSYFLREESRARQIGLFVVVTFSYSLCGRLLRFFFMQHVKHVIFLNWHSLCGRSASFALTVIGLERLGGVGESPGEPWADLGAFCG